MLSHPPAPKPTPPKRTRKTKAALQAEFDIERRAFEVVLGEANRKLEFAELQRVVAQRGLVPYVHSLEQFDKWLMAYPDLRKALQPILQELGLWEIKLGYDPTRDVKTSLVSPERMARVQS